jgi:hypothetical protein
MGQASSEWKITSPRGAPYQRVIQKGKNKPHQSAILLFEESGHIAKKELLQEYEVFNLILKLSIRCILRSMYYMYCSNKTQRIKYIKVKVKVKFTLEQATKNQRWKRGIALIFLQPRR